MRTHDCPVCREPGVPYQHATCAACWRVVPDPIRLRLLVAWRQRAKDPRMHREALTELLAWARDHRSAAQR